MSTPPSPTSTVAEEQLPYTNELLKPRRAAAALTAATFSLLTGALTFNHMNGPFAPARDLICRGKRATWPLPMLCDDATLQAANPHSTWQLCVAVSPTPVSLLPPLIFVSFLLSCASGAVNILKPARHHTKTQLSSAYLHQKGTGKAAKETATRLSLLSKRVSKPCLSFQMHHLLACTLPWPAAAAASSATWHIALPHTQPALSPAPLLPPIASL